MEELKAEQMLSIFSAAETEMYEYTKKNEIGAQNNPPNNNFDYDDYQDDDMY